MSKFFLEIVNRTIFRHSFISAILFVLALTFFTPSSVFADHRVDCGSGDQDPSCTLNFTATESGANPANQTFDFNADDPQCTGTITDDQPWLTMGPATAV
ncbi:MAG: hypothetical protein IID03_04005, partial [Candidatus Dadabacteria bacterium]|nr:hypothetical protein [Candidatus Dadabacteria bacterium]